MYLETDEYLDAERFRMDAERDAIYKTYETKVTVGFTIKTSAKNSDEAESEAYDDIENALRGSQLDYDFLGFDTEEVKEVWE